VHIRIVANLALKILRMLVEAGVQPSVEKHHKLTKDDAEVIVVPRGVPARYRAYRASYQSRAVLGGVGGRSVAPTF
jgi:hypothetical protein